jgi:hypothetical protein
MEGRKDDEVACLIPKTLSEDHYVCGIAVRYDVGTAV